MKIKDFLALSRVMTDVSASDKARLLNDLAHLAAAELQLSPEVISNALLKREELGSTGTGGGVAIPHARLLGVSMPFGMLALLSKAIKFDAIDGKPVDVVFLLLLPSNLQHGQLNPLACAARALRNAEVLQSLRRADGRAQAYRALCAESEH
jgi:PTS system nitrogen regulatory IIA component